MKKDFNAPWTIRRSSDYTEDPSDTDIQSIVDNKNQTVLFTDSGYFKPDEDYARLIAAAPDLLASLEALFEHCAMVHKHWGDGSNQKEADAAIKAGRAALQKARGE